MTILDEFKVRLVEEWLLPFCRHRGYPESGFSYESLTCLHPDDARDFIDALDRGLVTHSEGIFTAVCSKAREQIFWEGSRKTVPRPITLWLEPIVAIAGLARLHRDFGWPSAQLGMQSKTWAFDLVGYAPDQQTELLTCEVKKCEKEIDALLKLMGKHGDTASGRESDFKGSERNAFKKILGLRKSHASLFWALGPGHYGYVFEVLRGPIGKIELKPTHEKAQGMLKTRETLR